MAERTVLTMMMEPTPAVAMTLPAEVREKLAELELELSEGKFETLPTERGFYPQYFFGFSFSLTH